MAMNNLQIQSVNMDGITVLVAHSAISPITCSHAVLQRTEDVVIGEKSFWESAVWACTECWAVREIEDAA